MALNCYTGLMGSGKSYEVVSTVVLRALAAGRRVVSNVDGLSIDAIGSYIKRKSLGGGNIGELVLVTNDEISSAGFFPTDKTVDHSTSVVRAGDLVVIDECWRFWGAACKIPSEHTEFFRMHRHYVSTDEGHGCDIVMMIQDIGSLHRTVRNVVEFSTRTVKLKALGMHHRYRIELYETAKLNKTTRLDTFVKKYDPEIFPLYSSYKGGKGKEVVVDDRQNIFKNRKWLFIFGLLFSVCFLVWSGRYLWRYFHPKVKSVPASTTNGSPITTDAQRDRAPKSSASPLRLVGRMYSPTMGDAVIFADTENKLRYEFASVCSGPGLAARCLVDGLTVTASSGSMPSGDAGRLNLGGLGK